MALEAVEAAEDTITLEAEAMAAVQHTAAGDTEAVPNMVRLSPLMVAAEDTEEVLRTRRPLLSRRRLREHTAECMELNKRRLNTPNSLSNNSNSLLLSKLRRSMPNRLRPNNINTERLQIISESKMGHIDGERERDWMRE